MAQRHAHLRGQSAVLRAVRFVGQNNDVAPLGPRRDHPFVEFMDQAEHITAVLIAQQALQTIGTSGLVALAGGHAAAHKGGVDLRVQLHPVGQQHKGIGLGHGTVHLLAKEHHGIALAAALRVPEDAQLPLVHVWPTRLELGDRPVHA